jgi:hypothetical protein
MMQNGQPVTAAQVRITSAASLFFRRALCLLSLCRVGARNALLLFAFAELIS